MDYLSLYQQINQATNIYELVSRYVSLQKSGKGYKGVCPFHNDHSPSLSVSIELNIAKCMVCGQGGSPITFLSKIKNITPFEAAKELAKEAGIPFYEEARPYQEELKILKEITDFYNQVLNNTKVGEEALNYLDKRKISKEEIAKYQLGFAPNGNSLITYFKNKYPENNFIKKNILDKLIFLGIVIMRDNNYSEFFQNRLMIPIFNKNNEVIAFSGRALDNRTPKYINSPNSNLFNKSNTLFNINNLVRNKEHQIEELYLSEGFFDCFANNLAGINSVATMGVALSNNHAREISKLTNKVTILYDGDKAGLNASMRAMEILKPYIKYLNIVLLSNDTNKKVDPDSFIKTEGVAKYQEYLKANKQDYYQFVYQDLINSIDLNNNNEVAELIEKLEALFQNAPENVIIKYQEYLSEILGYEVKFKLRKAQLTSPEPTPKQIKEIKKEKFDLFSRRVNENEKILLNLLLQVNGGKKYLTKIIKKDRNIIMHFSNQGVYLFSLLEEYYKKYDLINYTIFEESIKEQKTINYDYEKLLVYYSKIKDYNKRIAHIDMENSEALDNLFNEYFNFFATKCALYKNELLPLESKIQKVKASLLAKIQDKYKNDDPDFNKTTKELEELSNKKKELKKEIGI